MEKGEYSIQSLNGDNRVSDSTYVLQSERTTRILIELMIQSKLCYIIPLPPVCNLQTLCLDIELLREKKKYNWDEIIINCLCIKKMNNNKKKLNKTIISVEVC